MLATANNQHQASTHMLNVGAANQAVGIYLWRISKAPAVNK